MVTQYPAVRGAAFTAVFPILDADGDLVTGAAGLDSEVSKDLGTFADCTNEATELATSSGMYYLTLTATEMTADIVAIIVKTTTTGAKTTSLVFYTSAQSLDTVDTNVDTLLTRVPSALSLTAGNVHAHVKATDDVLPATLSGKLPTNYIAGSGYQTDLLNTAVPAVNVADSPYDILLDTLGTDVWATAARTLTAHIFPFTNPAAPVNLTNLEMDGLTNAPAGTKTWALATVATEARLAELDAANLPANVDTLLTRITEALTLATIADAVRDEVIETSGATNLTVRNVLRIIMSGVANKTTGGGTATHTSRDYADTKARVTLTVDATGNRTTSTLDGT